MKNLLLTLCAFMLSIGLFAQYDGVNLALEKATSATSTEGVFTSDLAVDGLYNGASRWSSDWSNDDPTSDAAMVIDLGGRFELDSILFTWNTVNSAGQEALILGSYDSAYWYPMYEYATNGLVQDTLLFSESARYVMMKGISSKTYGYSLWEFEVYGHDSIEGLYLDSLSIDPITIDLDFGDTEQITLAGFDEYRDAFTVGATTWECTNEGNLSTNGLFTADKIGTFRVRAISERISDTVIVIVTSTAPIPTSIEISASNDTITEEETIQYTATVYDQNGTEVSGTAIDWSTAVNSINASGLFTGDFTGSHSVTASYSYTIGSVSNTITDKNTATVFPKSTENIALLADTAVAFSNSATNIAYLAIDNNSGTRWEAVANETDLEWVLQLDTIHAIGAVAIEWETAGAQSYTIELSKDSTTWEQAHYLNPNDTARSLTNHEMDSLAILGSAKFIRFSGMSRTFSPYGPSFWEFKVYEALKSVDEITVVEVTPATQTIDEGEELTLTANAYNALGDEVTSEFEWTVNSENASISEAGLFLSTISGVYEVTATTEDISGKSTITVTDISVLDSISVTPSTEDILENETQQFTAAAFDQFEHDFTTTFTWTSTGGTVSTSGLFTPDATGSFKVYAANGSVKDSAVINVFEKPILDSIAISPDDASIKENETQQFTAVGYDQFEDEFTAAFTWTASAGTIDATGLYTPAGGGEFKIYAANGAVKDSVVIVVAEIPRLDSIAVSPNDTSIFINKTVQYSALGFDQFEDEFDVVFTWTASSGTIDTEGLFTPDESGDFKVYASNGTTKDSATITIKALPYLAKIELTPESNTLPSETTLQFTASSFDQYDEEFDTDFTWSATGGSIDEDGLYTSPTAEGDYKVYVESGNVKDSASVTVTNMPTLVRITLTPQDTSVLEDVTVQYSAVGYDQYDAVFSSTITFTTNGGSIDANGLYTASEIGEFMVYVESEGVKDSTTVLVKEDIFLSSLIIDPKTYFIYDNQTAQVSATTFDQNNNAVDALILWSATGGEINNTGLFTPNATGEFTVYAENGALIDSAVVTVAAKPVLTSISISPDALTLKEGEEQQFTAEGFDQYNNAIDALIVWSIEGNGTISEVGLYTAGDTGTDIVKASDGEISATVSISVEKIISVVDDNSTNIIAYPNPVSSNLTIELNDFACNQINIYSITGALVYTQNYKTVSDNITVDMQNLETGIYYVIVNNNEDRHIIKISKF